MVENDVKCVEFWVVVFCMDADNHYNNNSNITLTQVLYFSIYLDKIYSVQYFVSGSFYFVNLMKNNCSNFCCCITRL